MGCDIHLYVERRENGHWITADRWTPDEYAEPGDTRLTVDYDNRFYTGRNYGLFAMLADVRNGRGFAGVKTGEGYVPIAEPRGLPEDVTPEVKMESDEWGEDGHSHSHFTVEELLAYDWTQVTCRQGWINGPEFEEWNRYARKRGNGPESFCGAVSGRDIQHVAIEEMERLVTGALGEKTHHTERATAVATLHNVYCLAEWTEPYFTSADQFLSETLPKLWRLGKPQDVRIVFWFDN